MSENKSKKKKKETPPINTKRNILESPDYLEKLLKGDKNKDLFTGTLFKTEPKKKMKPIENRKYEEDIFNFYLKKAKRTDFINAEIRQAISNCQYRSETLKFLIEYYYTHTKVNNPLSLQELISDPSKLTYLHSKIKEDTADTFTDLFNRLKEKK